MIKARQSIEVVSPEPIGGRNLLRYSETVDKNRYSWLSPYPLTAGKNGDRDYLETTVPADATSVSAIRGGADTTKVRTGKVLEPGIPYSYTLWIWCSKEAPFNNGSLGHIWTKESPDATDNHLENVISYSPAVIPANTWTRCEVLFTVSKQAFMIPFLYNVPKGSTFRFCNPKVEQGNQPTDWTPAPEDVENHISGEISSARTYSKQLADSITTGATDIIITDDSGQKLSTLRDAHHKITTTSQELSVMQAGVGTILKQSAAGWMFDWQTAAGGRIEFQDGGVIKVGSNAQSVRISDDSVRIGKDTQYQLITDDETIFYSSGAGDTRITNAGLESKQVSAMESLSVGGWKFLTTPDGDLIIA